MIPADPLSSGTPGVDTATPAAVSPRLTILQHCVDRDGLLVVLPPGWPIAGWCSTAEQGLTL